MAAEPGSPRPLYVAEPPPHLPALSRAVVDASVICAAQFLEPECDRAFEMIARYALAAPELLPYEVANAAANKLRRGLGQNAAREAVESFLLLDIELFPVDTLTAFDLAARYRLSAYDAAYLSLAGLLRAPLLTFDEKLAVAAASYLQ